MSKTARYIIYASSESGRLARGTVVNIVEWDETSVWRPPEGYSLSADPEGEYPIGSTFDAPAASART